MTPAYRRFLARLALDAAFRAEWERDSAGVLENETELDDSERERAMAEDVGKLAREHEAMLLARERTLRETAPLTTRALGRFATFQIREYAIEHPLPLADPIAEAVRFAEHAGSVGDGATRDVASYERSLLAPRSLRAVERYAHDVVAFARDAQAVAPAARESWVLFERAAGRLVVEPLPSARGRVARALLMGRSLADAVEQAGLSTGDADDARAWARERGLA